MRKNFTAIAAACLLTFGAFAQNVPVRNCGTMQHYDEQLKNEPSMRLRMEQIEQQTKNYETQNAANRTSAVVSIPVVFHVLYSTNNATQNVSDARIMEQLNVLNLDFSRTNADAGNTPAAFQGLAANTGVQFCLAVRDPSGNATTGIIRKLTATTSFSSNDGVKFNSSGGDNAWPAASYLNIWVCNLGGGLLGYAQFPGGPANTDGVVVLNGSVGGPAAPGTSTPYHLGRTLTHEVGHWVNLRHIWGDANCGNDLVSDTPTQQGSNFGCPAFPKVTCSNGPNGDMFMNYMDYTDDGCMNMFTTGQSTRMNALFAAGASRAGLVSSQGCVPVTAGGCGTTAGLSATAITQTTATLNWGAVSGATSYNVQYRVSPAGAWTLTTSTTTSKAISGLSAATIYDYQVQAVCTTNGTYSSIAQFTTASVVTGGCNGIDAYESNNSKNSAKPMPVNTDIYPLISSSTDKDWLSFTTTTAAPKIKVTLDGLPADFDVRLYNSAGTQIAISQNGGTTAESITYNTATTGSSYKVQVYGYSGAFSATACYRLNISTGAANFREANNIANAHKSNVSLYPNPAKNNLTITVQSDENQTSVINIVDLSGRNTLHLENEVNEGLNKIDVDLSKLARGIYFIQVNTNGEQTIEKLVIEK